MSAQRLSAVQRMSSGRRMSTGQRMSSGQRMSAAPRKSYQFPDIHLIRPPPVLLRTPRPKKKEFWNIVAPFVSIPKRSKQQAPALDDKDQFSFYLQKKPDVLLRDLSAFLSDSVDLPSLLLETADVLKKVTKSSEVTLYLTETSSNEIYIVSKKHEKDRHRVKWKIQKGSTVAAYVAHTKNYVMIDDLIEDIRFPEGVGYETEPIVKSVFCVPVVTPDGDCFAVLELYRQVTEPVFVFQDIKITIMVTDWMGHAIFQNQQRLALRRQQELNDYLLDLTKCYFGDNVMVEKMIAETVRFAKVTLNAERGSFFLMDPDSDELVANLYDDGPYNPDGPKTKVRIGKERGIAGLVARTGKSVNIKDAYTDRRFNKEIDQKTGFITRSILCMPIMGAEGILGVVQVINKKSGGAFTTTDENLFKTFSVYCAMALHYTKLNNQLNRKRLDNNIYLMLFKMQQRPCVHDMNEFIYRPGEVTIPSDFDEYSFYLEDDGSMTMPKLCLHMMLDLFEESEINMLSAQECILTARKLYRANPFHNFEHGFNVIHTMYLMLKQNKNSFTMIEMKALFLAALFQDVDHGGFTNNFLMMANDDLAKLYEESILENHQFDLTYMVVSRLHVYQNMSADDYKEFYREIKNAILATDLSHYFKYKFRLRSYLDSGRFTWKNPFHRRAVKTLMMVAANLSGQCKPYFVSTKITNNLYKEYYVQGDLEKKLGQCPLSVMDRTKEDKMAEDQVQTLSVIVIPCVSLLKIVLPSTAELKEGAELLTQTWQEIITVRGKRCWRQIDSIVQHNKWKFPPIE